jgi:type IV pilus assembly protein PilV
MKKYSPPSGRASAQQGITLLESLIALLILAIAVLGMLGVQLRTLAETQTGVRRAQAVRLIEDLAERIKSNPGGYSQLSAYVSNWTDLPADIDCAGATCTPAQLAQWDLLQWKRTVKQVLPSGEANLFQSTDETGANRRQLGVMVGWRANEKSDAKTNATDYAHAFVPTNSASTVNCNAGKICHLVYVQP